MTPSQVIQAQVEAYNRNGVVAALITRSAPPKAAPRSQATCTLR